MIKLTCNITKKLLAQIDEQGIYLYCKECRKEHLIPWKDIQDKMKQITMSANKGV